MNRPGGLSYLLLLLALAGCGYVGEPQPPLANIPARVNDLTAVQRGARILAQFTVPRLTTEGTAVRSPLQLDLRIGPGPDPFRAGEWAAAAKQRPEGPVTGGIARYEIPTAQWTGKEVLVAVRVTGSNGKDAGWSNFVTIPVVAPPETPMNVLAEAAPQGIRLTWTARGMDFRIYRRTGTGDFEVLATVGQPPWIDESARFGQRYDYQVQTIVKLTENREAQSELSMTAGLTYEDRFAPAPPAGVRAVASANSVELSWDRNTEADLAGYRVYRSVGGGPFERIAVPEIPAFSDRAVEKGKTYRYQISAVDQTGNESAHSASGEVALQ